MDVLLGCVKYIVTQYIKLLVDGLIIVVVSKKGIEGSELDPAGAELLSCILEEAADIGARHRNSKDAELKDLPDGDVHKVKSGGIVPEPNLGKMSSTREASS